jgi:hypothetical protein
MNGKSKCKILKEIRQQIAAENDIAYVVSECKHKGDCPGTCPKCESEVRYLEEQLRKRQLAGKKVAVAGVAAALMVTASGCDLLDILSPVTGGVPLQPSGYEEQVDGEIVAPTTMGKPVETQAITQPTEIPVPGEVLPDDLMGDVAAPTGD